MEPGHSPASKGCSSLLNRAGGCNSYVLPRFTPSLNEMLPRKRVISKTRQGGEADRSAARAQHPGKSKPLQESRGEDLLKQRFETLLGENNGIITKWNFTRPTNPHQGQWIDKQPAREGKNTRSFPSVSQLTLLHLPPPRLAYYTQHVTAVKVMSCSKEKKSLARFS